MSQKSFVFNNFPVLPYLHLMGVRLRSIALFSLASLSNWLGLNHLDKHNNDNFPYVQNVQGRGWNCMKTVGIILVLLCFLH